MASGERTPVRNSISGHKRHRTAHPTESMAPSTPSVIQLGSPANVGATCDRAPRTPCEEQNQRAFPSMDTRRGSSAAVETIDQRSRRATSEKQSQRTPLPRGARSCPSSANDATEKQARRHSQPREARAGPCASTPAIGRRPTKQIPREQAPEPTQSRDERLYPPSILPAPQLSRSTSSREHNQPRVVVSASTAEFLKTEQMLKVIEELRKLNDMFDCDLYSTAGSDEYNPGARQIRQRVNVQEDIVDDLERELTYTNRAIWNNPHLLTTVRSGGPYSDEIKEVLKRVPGYRERYETFQRMLQSLQRPPGGTGPGDEVRKKRIRALKLVIQDVWGDLACLACDIRNEEREQEATSNLTAGNVSRAGRGLSGCERSPTRDERSPTRGERSPPYPESNPSHDQRSPPRGQRVPLKVEGAPPRARTRSRGQRTVHLLRPL
jgi:hypothetical protein